MDVHVKNVDAFVVYSLSEYAVTVQFDDRINADMLERIRSFNALLHRHPFDGFRTTVPAYTTLSVYFDPLDVMQASRLTGINCFERVSNFLHGLQAEWSIALAPAPDPTPIPLCYGGAFGPDLDDVARQLGIAAATVIELHSAAIYRVHLIGFTPGFAYLGGMPKQLAVPRKASPRNKVTAGSVGIAAEQTGIYPLDTPGGWQIIGRTPLRLFDTSREQPALLKAGDRVVFQAIDHELFERFSSDADADSDN
ncbi:5-oxoprolinase subunit PxpB [Parapedobacter sp. 2B3]|uniref:5-oxoprolinase subunit PxpB n=1 Tax=Parapedobacter sp. 2B3 TaxID=3342381 RepID=UPI0035B6A1BC